MSWSASWRRRKSSTPTAGSSIICTDGCAVMIEGQLNCGLFQIGSGCCYGRFTDCCALCLAKVATNPTTNVYNC
jgi:hypothetical protein